VSPPAAPEAQRDAARVVAEAERICLVPAPTFDEQARGALVAELLAEAGGPDATTRLDDVGSVLCRFGPDGPAVVIAAHLDTVFTAEQPLAIVRRDGRISCPGLGDNALGVAALLHLARRLATAAPARPVVLAATVGEEGLGDLRGAKHLVETVPCACFVAVEGQSLNAIEHAAIGSTRYRVTYEGPGGHPWSERGSPSAVHGLATRVAELLTAAGDPDLVINVGRLQGGTSINTIAAQATLELDLRSGDPATLEAISRRADELLRRAPDGLRATLEVVGRRPSGGIAADHPLLVAARRARVTAGLAPAHEGASSTDANAAYGHGIPAITVGVSTGGNAHRADEYIDETPIAGGLRALTALARDLSGS
jgi:acetylornithine deacetylase/succinyl-diaminopimelate desuccinylase-like protein